MPTKSLFLLSKTKSDIFIRTFIVQIKMSDYLVAGAGFEPHDLRVMSSHIVFVLSNKALTRPFFRISKPTNKPTNDEKRDTWILILYTVQKCKIKCLKQQHRHSQSSRLPCIFLRKILTTVLDKRNVFVDTLFA